MSEGGVVDVSVEVARRYKAGEDATDLALEFGLTTNTVRRWLAAAGLAEQRKPAPDAAQIVAAYAAGAPLKSISSTFGIDDKTVLAMVRRAAQPMRRPRLTDETRNRIIAGYQAGAGVTKIARDCKVSRATVYRVVASAAPPNRRDGH